MSSKTVLIVDDSESICQVLSFLLGKEGHTTYSAFDGETGVKMARDHQPDVILLDIMMPVVDGWQAIRMLKADPATAAIPVIALTALRLTDAQVANAGFAGYLAKPVPTHRLKEAIRLACAPVP